MNDIDVAIIIVTYKSASFAIDCLDSIAVERSTPGLRIRVIVVDNASGDAQPIMRAIEKNSWSSWVTLVEAPRNGGFSYGNNLGIRRAYEDGPPAYFHLLNPDTRVFKGAVGALVQFLEAHHNVGIAGSRLEDFNGAKLAFGFRFPSILNELDRGLGFGWISRVFRLWTAVIDVLPEPQPVDWVSGTSMMIRQNVIESIGGLDENYFLYFEDPDFCFRAKKAGFSTWCVPDSRIMHISGQSTGVTGHQSSPRRLPAYWYESRRRFFSASYGVWYAWATDVVALLAYSLGSAKLLVQRREHHRPPHLVTDLARHSVLWPKNWKVNRVKSFVPSPKH